MVTKDMRMDLDKYRAEFPITERCIFLNHASRSPIPQRSLRAMEALSNRLASEPGDYDEELFTIVHDCRERAAQLIHADADEIALMPNTSTGLNFAANALSLQHGDNVVIPDNEFPANVYPWLHLRRRGIEIRFARTHDGACPVTAIEQQIDQRTRIVSISIVSFASGFRCDLEGIGKLCQSKGIHLVVDGIQGVGVLDVDVHAHPISILACGSGKWLMSPWGTGFLYISRRVRDELEPPYIGWLSMEGCTHFEDMLNYRYAPYPDGRRFEVGSLAYHDFCGMRESLGLLLEVGQQMTEQRSLELIEQFTQELEQKGYEITTPQTGSGRSGILCFKDSHVDLLFQKLMENGVRISKREGSIRTSFHFYNREDEIHRMLELIGPAS
jgi:cysteine desulfurase/selenocysteine lyase